MKKATPGSRSFSDLDPARWKEDLNEIIVDSLWLLGARDRTGVHRGDYWGNFVPQIPHQVLRRFTRKGEVLLDLFCGMGTSLIEGRRLGRHGIGVELNPEVLARARERVEEAENPFQVKSVLLQGDAASRESMLSVSETLGDLGRDLVDVLILHPPYHDIIRFSEDPGDLSAASSLDSFLQGFETVCRNGLELLRGGRFAALVIGDKYERSELIPLGFLCMDVCRRLGLRLKAINVKDIQGNERGKGKSGNLWRFRALKQGFYIFKHEYVMIFQKPF